jgi:hypothetical protein
MPIYETSLSRVAGRHQEHIGLVAEEEVGVVERGVAEGSRTLTEPGILREP